MTTLSRTWGVVLYSGTKLLTRLSRGRFELVYLVTMTTLSRTGGSLVLGLGLGCFGRSTSPSSLSVLRILSKLTAKVLNPAQLRINLKPKSLLPHLQEAGIHCQTGQNTSKHIARHHPILQQVR